MCHSAQRSGDAESGGESESEYVDAWSEAGKRMEIPDENELEE